MELLIIFAVGMLVWLAFMFVKFLNLKAKLMSELGAHGIGYEVANFAYAYRRTFINEMYHDGYSACDIAAVLAHEIDPTRELYWINYVLDILFEQIADVYRIVSVRSGKTLFVNENFIIACQQSDFATDYFASFISGLLLYNRVVDEKVRVVVSIVVFIRLFGDDVGELMYRQSIERSATREELTGEWLTAGIKRGADNAIDYAKSGKSFNFRWIE